MRRTHKKQKYMPYFFDYKNERRTYKYVGKDLR